MFSYFVRLEKADFFLLQIVIGTLMNLRFPETHDEVKLSHMEMTRNFSLLKYSTQREYVRQAEGVTKRILFHWLFREDPPSSEDSSEAALMSAVICHLEKHPKVPAALIVQLAYTAWVGPWLHRGNQPHNPALLEGATCSATPSCRALASPMLQFGDINKSFWKRQIHKIGYF